MRPRKKQTVPLFQVSVQPAYLETSNGDKWPSESGRDGDSSGRQLSGPFQLLFHYFSTQIGTLSTSRQRPVSDGQWALLNKL